MMDQMRFTHENAIELLRCVKEPSGASNCKSLFVNSLRHVHESAAHGLKSEVAQSGFHRSEQLGDGAGLRLDPDASGKGDGLAFPPPPGSKVAGFIRGGNDLLQIGERVCPETGIRVDERLARGNPRTWKGLSCRGSRVFLRPRPSVCDTYHKQRWRARPEGENVSACRD
jgi:hypothetical protein